ncbi:MAG: hypothetical protein R3F39_00400 [Myxococcota bacterium]
MRRLDAVVVGRGAKHALALAMCFSLLACGDESVAPGPDGAGDFDGAGPDAEVAPDAPADAETSTADADAGPELDVAPDAADAPDAPDDSDSLADVDSDAEVGPDALPDALPDAVIDAEITADAAPDAPEPPVYCQTMPAIVSVMAEKEPSADSTPVEVWFPACSATPPVPLTALLTLPPAIVDSTMTAEASTRSDVLWAGAFFPAPSFDRHPLTEAYRAFADSHPRAAGPLPWKAQIEQMFADETKPPGPTPKPTDFATLRQHLINALGLEFPLAELAARPVRFAVSPWHSELRVIDGKAHRYEWADIVWRHDLLGSMDGVIARPVDPVDSPAPAIVMEHGHDLPDLRFLPQQPDPTRGGIHQWFIEFGGREFAERGYVVFASATRSFLSWEAQTALLLTEQTETPLLGVMVLETLTKVAILRALPFVDPARVGGFGHSAGGHRLRATAAVHGFFPIAVDYGFSAYTDDPPSVPPHCETIPTAGWIQSPMQELRRFPFPMLVFGYHYAPCTTPCGGGVHWLPVNDLQTPPVTREVLRDFFDIALKHASPN